MLFGSLMNQVWVIKYRPTCKKFKLDLLYFTFGPPKLPNFDQAYLLQFLSYAGVPILFRNLKRCSTSHFGTYFSFEAFILIISSLGKTAFERCLKMTCNLSLCIS